VIAHEDAPGILILIAEVPEFRGRYEEHLLVFEDALPHLLFGELSRFTLEAYGRHDSELVVRILDLMERFKHDGDKETRNLVDASFIENIAPADVDRLFFALCGPLTHESFQRWWGDLG
jgi:hypothetical protein